MIAEFIIFCMCADPTDKQVNPGRSKMIFTNHPVAIPSNVKSYPITPLPQ